MATNNSGFRIHTHVQRAPADLVGAFAGIPVANVGDSKISRQLHIAPNIAGPTRQLPELVFKLLAL